MYLPELTPFLSGVRRMEVQDLNIVIYFLLFIIINVVYIYYKSSLYYTLVL